jgi:hypothetical protein
MTPKPTPKPWPFPVSVLADGRVVRRKLPRPARPSLARLPAAPW